MCLCFQDAGRQNWGTQKAKEKCEIWDVVHREGRRRKGIKVELRGCKKLRIFPSTFCPSLVIIRKETPLNEPLHTWPTSAGKIPLIPDVGTGLGINTAMPSVGAILSILWFLSIQKKDGKNELRLQRWQKRGWQGQTDLAACQVCGTVLCEHQNRQETTKFETGHEESDALTSVVGYSVAN